MIRVRYALLFIISVIISIGASAQEFVLATYTYSTNNRLDNLRPLADYLSRETGYTFSVKSFATVQDLITAIRGKQVDLAMINTLGYLSAVKKYGEFTVPLVSLDPGSNVVTGYGGCLLARKEAGITKLQDLRKVRDTIYNMALVSNSSTSGNLVPRLLLNQAGVESIEKSYRVYYAGTHKQVIADMLAGKATVGGCGCNEYEKSVKEIPGFSNDIVLVASFNDIPLGPVVCRNDMTAATRRKIESALLKVHREHPATFKNFCAGWTEFLGAVGFRRAADADYNTFRRMFGSNESLWKLLE